MRAPRLWSSVVDHERIARANTRCVGESIVVPKRRSPLAYASSAVEHCVRRRSWAQPRAQPDVAIRGFNLACSGGATPVSFSLGLGMEPCPHCTKDLDPQLHFVRGSLAKLPNALLGWERPSARRARKFTVRCPHCSKTYVSHTLRRFGFVTYGNYVLFVGLICFAAVAIVLLARPRS